MDKPKRCGEEGYATIAAAGIIVAIVSLLLIVAAVGSRVAARHEAQVAACLLYTSPSPRDKRQSRMPSSA